MLLKKHLEGNYSTKFLQWKREKKMEINNSISHLRKLKQKEKKSKMKFDLKQMEGHNKQKAEINKTENYKQ